METEVDSGIELVGCSAAFMVDETCILCRGLVDQMAGVDSSKDAFRNVAFAVEEIVGGTSDLVDWIAKLDSSKGTDNDGHKTIEELFTIVEDDLGCVTTVDGAIKGICSVGNSIGRTISKF